MRQDKNSFTFDERSTNQKEIIQTAQRKWPDASLEFMEVLPYGPNEFSQTIRNDPQIEFRSDGQLTVYPSINLAELSRIISRQPGACDPEKVRWCGGHQVLHLILIP